MFNSEMTVREVTARVPESTRLFETLKIDYCCGGNRPLTEACASAGVELDDVMELLSVLDKSGASDSVTIDFQKLSLTELITHILETHHVFTKSEMRRIQALAEKVIGAHGANHPELLTVGELFQRLCTDLNPHMFKEEQILFPYIVAMGHAFLIMWGCILSALITFPLVFDFKATEKHRMKLSRSINLSVLFVPYCG